MALTVYADVLLIVNLYVDFFLLWCADRALGLGARPWRLGAGALLGALGSLVCLLPGQPGWLSFLWGGACALLTAGGAFLPRPPRVFLQAALALWGFSLGLGGLFLFLIRWAAPGNMALVGHAVYLDLSPGLLFFFTLAAYGVFWPFKSSCPGRTWRAGPAASWWNRGAGGRSSGPGPTQAAPCGSPFPACR